MDRITFFDIKQLLESSRPIPDIAIDFLVKKDMLLHSKDTLLPGYIESPIHFEPTYKRDPITGYMKLEKKTYLGKYQGRLPGYTDRVFVKSSFQNQINITYYRSIPITGNDHYPVFYHCTIQKFRIAIITWNIGGGDPTKICPNNFPQQSKEADILVIGFQEACIYTRPRADLWKHIYNSSLEMHGSNIKAFLGHIAGFGLETCVLWNNTHICAKQVLPQTNIGSVTKGLHRSMLSFTRLTHKSSTITCIFGNVHAPFTENITKYFRFFKTVHAELENDLQEIHKLSNHAVFPLV